MRGVRVGPERFARRDHGQGVARAVGEERRADRLFFRAIAIAEGHPVELEGGHHPLVDLQVEALGALETGNVSGLGQTDGHRQALPTGPGRIPRGCDIGGHKHLSIGTQK